MSPIYVRPEREQAEHDRLIRFLQAQYSREFEALANPGEERVAPVKVATTVHYPDLVLNEDQRLAGLVEIETAASVNNLETMAKWVPFSRARVPFHLYVPVQGYEAALRLAEAHHVKAAEIWTYRSAVEGFDLVRMFVDASLQVAKPPRGGKAAAKAAAARAVAAKPAAAPPEATKPAAPKPAPAKPVAAKPVPAKPVPAKPAARTPATGRGAVGVKKPAAKAAKPVVKPPAKAATKATTKATPKASARPKPAPARRPTPAARSSRTSPVKPPSKGGKKGAAGRKGR